MQQPYCLFGIAALGAAIIGCGTPEEPASSLEPRYGTVSATSTVEPVAYTDVPYDFTGATSIEDLYGIINDELTGNARVWFGTAPSAPFPFSGACDRFGTTIATVDALPVEIEGIITLHPRYFQNLAICQSEERFYGSYFIEDSTGGILVQKDSRIADFRMGDRVKLTVNTVMFNFGAYGVLGRVGESVVSRDHEIFAEYIGERNLAPTDIGKTVTVRRELASDATNYNFSEMCLIPEGGEAFLCSQACIANEQCTSQTSPARPLLVSLDREIEQRDPLVFEIGDVLEITGPVTDSFGLRILVARAGQISFVEE